jgi:lysophospholipase L1-like esterase
MMLKKKNTIVLQGDSVTDAGRFSDPQELGYGYARMVATGLQSLYPDYELTVYNRGISGHRTGDLVNRWDKDTLNLKPDIVTILIGINDVWRRFDSNDPTSVEVYAANYEKLMKSVKDFGAKLIIIEPFALRTGAVTDLWREDIDPKIHATRKLAQKYADSYIPADGIFSALSLVQPPEFWAADGVHPTAEGHRVLTKEILKALGAI